MTEPRADDQGSVVGAAQCAGAMLLLGSSVAVSGVLTDYPVLTGQAWRYLVAGLVLLAVARARHLPWVRPTVRELAWLGALAAVGMAGFNIVLLASLEEADPAVVGSILGTAPVVMAIVVAARLGRWPAGRVTLGALVVTAGVFLIEGAGRASPTGLLLAVGVLACEIGFSLLAIPLLSRLGPLRMSAYACLLAVPMLLASTPAEPGAALVLPTASQVGAIAWLAVVVTAMAFVWWYSGLARLGAERAGLFLGLVPVGAMGTGYILGLVEPTVWGSIGCLVCTCGITIGAAKATGRRHRGAAGQEAQGSPSDP